MNLKPGDRVKIIDGHGQIVSKEATVARYAGGSIIFVHDKVNGEQVLYGVPIGSVEPVEVNTRPSLGDVVHALRTCFVKEETK